MNGRDTRRHLRTSLPSQPVLPLLGFFLFCKPYTEFEGILGWYSLRNLLLTSLNEWNLAPLFFWDQNWFSLDWQNCELKPRFDRFRNFCTEFTLSWGTRLSSGCLFIHCNTLPSLAKSTSLIASLLMDSSHRQKSCLRASKTTRIKIGTLIIVTPIIETIVTVFRLSFFLLELYVFLA